jgi:hypothetical protein
MENNFIELGYVPYKGGTGPTQSQITSNDHALIKLLAMSGLIVEYELDHIYAKIFDPPFKTVNITHPKTGDVIHCSYDRWGFVVDELDVDQKNIEGTLKIILNWYYGAGDTFK